MLEQLGPIQIVLIVSLFLVGGLGYWNQRRMKKKEEEEMYDMPPTDGGSNEKQAGTETSGISEEMSEEEKAVKSYIDMYKSSYPKESLVAALVNNGTPQERAEELVNKYY